MTVAEATTAERGAPAPAGASPAAFCSRREASILVVAVGLVVFFSVEELGLPRVRQHQEHHRVDGADRDRRDRRGDAADLRRDRSCRRPRVRARAGDHVCSRRPTSTTCRSGSASIARPRVAPACVGLVNGIVTTYLRVPSFITTLGMLFLLNGITLNLTDGSQAVHAGRVDVPDDLRVAARALLALAELRVLLGARADARRPVRAHLDTLGPAHGRHRRQPDRRRGGRCQRPPHQDRQLRARERARRLRRHPRLRPG